MSENRYPLSRNYRKLRHYLDQGLLIVCFADRKVDGSILREVCAGSVTGEGEFRRYSFSAGGLEIASWNESLTDKIKGYPPFEKMMRKHNIEYIDL